jgi:hypothetical protein
MGTIVYTGGQRILFYTFWFSANLPHTYLAILFYTLWFSANLPHTYLAILFYTLWFSADWQKTKGCKTR